MGPLQVSSVKPLNWVSRGLAPCLKVFYLEASMVSEPESTNKRDFELTRNPYEVLLFTDPGISVFSGRAARLGKLSGSYCGVPNNYQYAIIS